MQFLELTPRLEHPQHLCSVSRWFEKDNYKEAARLWVSCLMTSPDAA
jgi:hypothetical protein